MIKKLMILSGTLLIGLLVAGARADELTFLSTQLRPLEEAQKARTQILKRAPMPVVYVPEEPPQLAIHLQADEQGAHTISLVGALHGELAPVMLMVGFTTVAVPVMVVLLPSTSFTVIVKL